MIVGEGKHRYELVEGWEQLPSGWSHGDVGGVATDSNDNVYMFNRGDHPVIIYDSEGKFLGSWGDKTTYPRAHGITIVDDIVYLVDDADHTVRKCTLDGKILMTLGTSGKPSDTGYRPNVPGNLTTIERVAGPFHRPTRLAIAPDGDLLVADGYGNARIHRFNPDGTLMYSWGEPGTGPGQFMLPHSVWAHTNGEIWITDRENDRIQIFSQTGDLLRIWTNVTRPNDLFVNPDGTVIIGELAWEKGATSLAGRVWPEKRDARLTIRDGDGNVLAAWGEEDPCSPGGFAAPHGLWVDSKGSIYVAEVTHTALSRYNRWHESCHSIVKYARI
jgi:hypothetical protein